LLAPTLLPPLPETQKQHLKFPPCVTPAAFVCGEVSPEAIAGPGGAVPDRDSNPPRGGGGGGGTALPGPL